MIILTKEMISKNDELNAFLDNEKQNLNSNIKLQQNLKEILLDYMQKFADCTANINPDYANDILNFLEDLKCSLNLSNENLESLDSLVSMLDKLIFNINKNPELDITYVSDFNSNNTRLNKIISENTIHIEDFLHSILTFSELNFFTAHKESLDLPEENTTIIKQNDIQKENINNVEVETPIEKEPKKAFEYIDNTLIISELKGKVFLPYKLSKLEETLKENSDRYLSLEDIIEKEYTIPFNAFKNLSIARFREAFKLMRNKEKKSIKAAFDLGMELLFNYNLHPAIISACKNLDELDIYLDYLDNNETDKFDLFNISFEVAPVLVKDKKNSYE